MMDFSTVGLNFSTTSDADCSVNHKLNCSISSTELVQRDVIAMLRCIVSALSIIGSFSIIISVIRKRQIFSPKIHPIFMLSIADFILAVLWTIGGGMWMSADQTYFNFSRKGCFAVLLATVIVECVTVNLTCVYAFLAYSSIKQKDFSNVYSLFEKDEYRNVWKPWKSILIYLIAWFAPIILILVPFIGVNLKYDLVQNTDRCTCWCIPYFGNVKPHASLSNIEDKEPVRLYLHQLGIFVLIYSVVIAIHYILGFIFLFVVYIRILFRIRKMRDIHRRNTRQHNSYGATEAILSKGQSQAKTRVVFFLTAFVICSFFNIFLAIVLVRHTLTEFIEFNDKPMAWKTPKAIPVYVMAAYIFQSVTVPLQGFLNAIVYGWTREDFIQAIAIHKSKETQAVILPTNSLQHRRNADVFTNATHSPDEQCI